MLSDKQQKPKDAYLRAARRLLQTASIYEMIVLAAKLAQALNDYVQALEADRLRLRAALQEIRDNHGRVCEDFATCAHPACTSSYVAWYIADGALGERKDDAEQPTA